MTDRSAAKLADEIVVTQTPDRVSLTVDGHEFPWHVEKGVCVVIDDAVPGVAVTIQASRVRVDHDIDVHPEDRAS